MSFKRLSILVLSSATALSLTACGGGEDPVILTPEGDNHQYVMSALDLPEDSNEAQALGFDLDANGSIDNRLGQVIGALANFDLEAQPAVDEQVDTAGFVILVNVQAKALDNSDRVGVSVFLGDTSNVVACADPDDTVCRLHLDGQTEFAIDADSPRDALIVGNIGSGRFTEAEAGTVTLQIALDAESAPIELTLASARLEISAVADGTLTGGKLGGAIPEDDLQNGVLPAVSGIIGDVIADECPDAVPGACCPAGSIGEQVLGFLDANADCVVSVEEIAENDVLRALLNSDVDTNGDGEPDALSLGIKFDAVSAIFDPAL